MIVGMLLLAYIQAHFGTIASSWMLVVVVLLLYLVFFVDPVIYLVRMPESTESLMHQTTQSYGLQQERHTDWTVNRQICFLGPFLYLTLLIDPIICIVGVVGVCPVLQHPWKAHGLNCEQMNVFSGAFSVSYFFIDPVICIVVVKKRQPSGCNIMAGTRTELWTDKCIFWGLFCISLSSLILSYALL